MIKHPQVIFHAIRIALCSGHGRTSNFTACREWRKQLFLIDFTAQ